MVTNKKYILTPFSFCGMMRIHKLEIDVMSSKELNSYYGARYRDNLRKEMIENYGGVCVLCGHSNPAALCLDHINDDSDIEKEYFRDGSRGGDKLYALLKREGWPKDRFQLLCYNCNALKEHSRRRQGVVTGREYADRRLVQARIGKQRNNTSGVKGVFWNSQKGRWHAQIMENYKYVHLGFYDDIRDAAAAYNKRAIETWGDEANVTSQEEIDMAAMYWDEVPKFMRNSKTVVLDFDGVFDSENDL
jgi:hypothetical protein